MFLSRSYPDSNKDPEIIAWEILLNENDYESKIGLAANYKNALVIELKDFQNIYPKDHDKNFGNSFNLAAGQNYLMLNYEHFDKVHGYIICGFNQHVELKSRSCVLNKKGYFSLDFPDFHIVQH